MHLSNGQLKAYQDGALPAEESRSMEAHLADCPRCQLRAAEMAARSQRVRQHLSALDPHPAESPISAKTARSQFQAYFTRKETTPMFQKIFSKQLRPAWAILSVVAILAIALSFPSVRAAAVSFLGLFRVQKVTVVQFNPADLPDLSGNTESYMTQLFSDNVQMTEIGEPQDAADAAEASAAAGIAVRLPASFDTLPDLTVQPSVTMTFTVDLPILRAILEEMGRGDIVLPDDLDGTVVTAVLPAPVTARYGDCDRMTSQEAREAGYDPDDPSSWPMTDCTVLVQFASPTISAPPGLDVAAIGKAFLQMTGMSAADADAFSQTVDWSSTLVLPIPTSADYREVQVDGVSGAFVSGPTSSDGETEYMLIWVKDGVMYALNGSGSLNEAAAIANSLK